MKFKQPNEFNDILNQIFEEVKSRIIQILPDCDVDHVGSSSIKGAISKGDLDILVRVDKSKHDESVELIKTLGFEIKQGTLRTEFLCMLSTAQFNEDVAIQLVARGSEFENFLKFRDLLNNNPKLLDQYNQLKFESTELDANAYRIKKSKFIEAVLAQANS